MTGVTRQGGGNMGRAFTGGHDIVVAVGAGGGGLAVVYGDQGGHPHIGAVATIAEVTGHRMGGRFKSAGTATVVTTGLCTGLPGHHGMIEYHTQPGGGVVAYIASGGGHHMGGPFAGGCDVVVAVGTLIRALTVIKGQGGGSPGGVAVAGFAQVAGNGVSGGFKGASRTAIVASGTGTSGAGLTVIKRGNQDQEAAGQMTGLAHIAGERMRRPLP